MIIEFDDGTKIRIDEKQDDWTFRVARGKSKWKYFELQTNANSAKSMDILNLGPEWREMKQYGTGYPHYYSEWEGGWKPV